MGIVSGLAGVIAGSIRGNVKDIFLPRPEGESASLTSSPCSLCEPLRLGFLPSGPAASLAWFHLSCIFNLVATTSIGLRSWQAEWLPGWQHIDLSEARGLVLFWVVREAVT